MKPAEEYILNQEEPYRGILMHVQLIMEATLPEFELKYKWRIPCYFVGKSPICYLNASAKKGYVDVGFWNAAQLTKHPDHLVSEKRRVVRSLRYYALSDINDKVLIDVVQEAYTLRNGKFYRQKDLD